MLPQEQLKDEIVERILKMKDDGKQPDFVADDLDLPKSSIEKHYREKTIQARVIRGSYKPGENDLKDIELALENFENGILYPIKLNNPHLRYLGLLDRRGSLSSGMRNGAVEEIGLNIHKVKSCFHLLKKYDTIEASDRTRKVHFITEKGRKFIDFIYEL